MKTLSYSKTLAVVLAFGAIGLTSCIEETFPMSETTTADQLSSNAKATEALLQAPSAFLNNYNTLGDGDHNDWGYGAIMHIRDLMTADMVAVDNTYGTWFSYWSANSYLGERYTFAYLPFNYYYQAIQTANNLIRAIDLNTATDSQKGMYGVGCAWRALFYLDMARMYEFLPNDMTSSTTPEGNLIDSLTVAIVTENTTEELARNNPRAHRRDMAAFIIEDLDSAQKYIENLDASLAGYTVPSLATVYGLKARTYMWLEDYPNAATYAGMAITEAGSPMSKDECLNTSTGFNTPTRGWMLCSQQNDESQTVQTGIVNWTSWMSNEALFGYSAAGPYLMIGSQLYDKIHDNDFRKLLYKAPDGTSLAGKEAVLDTDGFGGLPTYASLKFRPGQGNTDEYKIGAATAYPLMRVEEMHFIYAEALARQSPYDGKSYLESFMQTYRCEDYVCEASSQEDIVSEIIAQKRIEFFGEGLSFFDIKRLNYSVDRTLNRNTNPKENFKTNGRPAWMNFCLTYSERINNTALEGWQNPDPSGKYMPVE